MLFTVTESFEYPSTRQDMYEARLFSGIGVPETQVASSKAMGDGIS
jgi:hypothetical protein